jgi:hypothetical protein
MFFVFFWITILSALLTLRIIVMILNKWLSINSSHFIFLFLSIILIIFHFIFNTWSSFIISLICNFIIWRRITKSVLTLLNTFTIMWWYSMLRSFLVIFCRTWKLVSYNWSSFWYPSGIASTLSSSIIIKISFFVKIHSKRSISIRWLRMWSAHIISY